MKINAYTIVYVSALNVFIFFLVGLLGSFLGQGFHRYNGKKMQIRFTGLWLILVIVKTCDSL